MKYCPIFLLYNCPLFWEEVKKKEGNVAYMLEYSHQNNDSIYESVFLDLSEFICYRINENRDEFRIIDSLELGDRNFEEKNTLGYLQNANIQKQPLIRDPIAVNSISNLFGQNRWHPS